MTAVVTGPAAARGGAAAPRGGAAAVSVSVVIAHLNQPAALEQCLAALMAGTRRPDEIIVVDNGSKAVPRAACARFEGVRLERETEPGPGPARNRGAACASGDILAFIDADCRADPGWVAEMARIFVAEPRAQILGGDVRIAAVEPSCPTLLECYESIYAYRMDRYIARKGVTGSGNLAVRRSAFEAVGGFAGILVAEDMDWCRRATRLGYAIRYAPGMRVYHPARACFAELAGKWDRHVAHEFGAARGARGYARWLAKTAAMGVSPIAEIPRIAISDRVTGARARLLAFAGVVRIRLHRTRRMAALALTGKPESLAWQWNRGDDG